MAFLTHDWIAIPLLAILIFVMIYLWCDKVLNFLHHRSLGQREDLLQMLDKMFVETDRKKVTALLLLLSFGLGAIVFILTWPNLILGLVAGSIFTVLGWSIPKVAVNALYERRCTLFTNQMVDGMTIMANGIKSGLSVPQSMERVVDNLKNPIKQEFGLVLSQMRIGRSLEEALNELGDRIPRPDVQMFVTSINILKETGGNLAETFQTITSVVRERQKLEKKIQALTAQGLAQGVIITLVPFMILIVFFVLDPNYIMPMFTTTLGIILLMVMFTLQIIGGVMIKKIVTIKV